MLELSGELDKVFITIWLLQKELSAKKRKNARHGSDSTRWKVENSTKLSYQRDLQP
jgi:hypothetical protein